MASQSIAAGASDLALQKARGATRFRTSSGVDLTFATHLVVIFRSSCPAAASIIHELRKIMGTGWDQRLSGRSGGAPGLRSAPERAFARTDLKYSSRSRLKSS